MNVKKLLVVILVLGVLILGGCKIVEEEGGLDVETVVADLVSTPIPEVTDVEAEEPTATIAAEVEETADEPQPEGTPTPLPMYPLKVNFTADDGQNLAGDFFPPATAGAPVVVLMHQYDMDHNVEWLVIAPWLQNRGLIDAVRSGGQYWADPTWFPPLIEGLDFGVFSYSFRNCIGGCNEDSVESREEWIIDAVSAIKAAGSFTSVDKQRVIVVGTSIGADGAVNACERLLENDSVSCIGVISISPGNFLDVDYAESVKTLTEAGVPVQCVASEYDVISADTCLAYEGENYESIIVEGGEHGIRLFDPNLSVNLPGLIAGSLVEWTYVE